MGGSSGGLISDRTSSGTEPLASLLLETHKQVDFLTVEVQFPEHLTTVAAVLNFLSLSFKRI